MPTAYLIIPTKTNPYLPYTKPTLRYAFTKVETLSGPVRLRKLMNKDPSLVSIYLCFRVFSEIQVVDDVYPISFTYVILSL